jgi:hypothetical protein
MLSERGVFNSKEVGGISPPITSRLSRVVGLNSDFVSVVEFVDMLMVVSVRMVVVVEPSEKRAAAKARMKSATAFIMRGTHTSHNVQSHHRLGPHFISKLQSLIKL